jgi:hypothetical protein
MQKKEGGPSSVASITVMSSSSSTMASSSSSIPSGGVGTPKLWNKKKLTMKEKKQQFHLTMEKALGGLRVGSRSTTSTLGVGGSKMVASAAHDDNSIVPPTSTDDPQQLGKSEQATDVGTSQVNTSSSSSDQQRIIPSVPSYCFISIEEEINNNINSTPSTDKHCFSLLKRFYDELMTPAFPLEEERDDISDWLWCFSTQMHSKQYPQQAPTNSNDNDEGNEGQRVTKKKNNTENQRRCVMDVILMIQQQQQQQDSDNNNNSSISNKQSTILGGAVIAYYRNSRVGLLSYVVLNEEYRGCGLAKKLHNEALRRMEMLANSYCLDSIESSNNNNNSQNTTALRAIFAETNTHTAGDITPTQCLLRHKSLYNLGYRRVNFPYSQPPLSPEDGSNASFDDIMLLSYLPLSNDYRSRMNQNNTNDESSLMRYCSWFFEKNEINQFVDEEDDDDGNESSNNLLTTTVKMDVNIPLGFIEDFYISQGFRRDATCGSDYRTADYYKFAHWFADRCHLKQQEQQGCGGSGVVEVSLHRPNIAPWEDIKESLLQEWTEEVRKNKPQDLI